MSRFAKFGKICSTVFAVLAFIVAIASIQKSIITFICFLLVGALLLPITKEFIRKSTHDKPEVYRIIKPTRIIAMVLLFFIGVMAAPESETDVRSNKEIVSQPSIEKEEVRKFTDSEIKSIVVKELISEIEDYFPEADANSCKYNINKKEYDSEDIYVYGTVTLYDKYGALTSGKTSGSGSAFRTFTVEISKDTGYASADIE